MKEKSTLKDNEKEIIKLKKLYNQYIVPMDNNPIFLNFLNERDSTMPLQEKLNTLIEKDLKKINDKIYKPLQKLASDIYNDTIPDKYKEYIQKDDFTILKTQRLLNVKDEKSPLDLENLFDTNLKLKELRKIIRDTNIFNKNSRIITILEGKTLDSINNLLAQIDLSNNKIVDFKWTQKDNINKVFSDIVGFGGITDIIKDSTYISVVEDKPGRKDEDTSKITNISKRHEKMSKELHEYIKTQKTYFGAIEVDKDADVEKFFDVIKFIDKNLPLNIPRKVFSKVRKLGRMGASGVYYPQEDLVAVDIDSLTSTIHELIHFSDMSQERTESEESKRNNIINYFSSKIDRVKLEEDHSSSSRYGTGYYLNDEEVIARLGEIFVLLSSEREELSVSFKDKEGLDARIIKTRDGYEKRENEYFNFTKFTEKDIELLNEYYTNNIFINKPNYIKEKQDKLSEQTHFTYNDKLGNRYKRRNKIEIFKKKEKPSFDQEKYELNDIERLSSFIKKSNPNNLREWLYSLKTNSFEDYEYVMDFITKNMYEVLKVEDGKSIGLSLGKKYENQLFILSYILNLKGLDFRRPVITDNTFLRKDLKKRIAIEEQDNISFLNRESKNQLFISQTINRLSNLSRYYYKSSGKTVTCEKYNSENKEEKADFLVEITNNDKLREYNRALSYTPTGNPEEKIEEHWSLSSKEIAKYNKIIENGKPIKEEVLSIENKSFLKKIIKDEMNQEEIETLNKEFYPDYIGESYRSSKKELENPIYKKYTNEDKNTDIVSLNVLIFRVLINDIKFDIDDKNFSLENISEISRVVYGFINNDNTPNDLKEIMNLLVKDLVLYSNSSVSYEGSRNIETVINQLVKTIKEEKEKKKQQDLLNKNKNNKNKKEEIQTKAKIKIKQGIMKF